jgi:hypothetical protein
MKFFLQQLTLDTELIDCVDSLSTFFGGLRCLASRGQIRTIEHPSEVGDSRPRLLHYKCATNHGHINLLRLGTPYG